VSRGLLGFLALAVIVVTATGCGSGNPEAVLARVPPATTSTTAAAPAPPTTAAASGPGALVTSTGVVVPVVGVEGDRRRVRSPCGREVVVAGGTPVGQATIVLDPGHGGVEPGAVAPDGQREAAVNLDVAKRVQAALERQGVSVVLTRTEDYDVSLRTRAEIARSLSPRAFLSIHHNAEPDGPSPRPGTETYYQLDTPDSKRLSGLIYEEVLKALSRFQAAWVADNDAGAKYRRGQQGDYYAMLRLPQPVVSVLVESAFISNPAESRLLARPEVRQAEADAVAGAVTRYLNTDDPGSGYVEPYPRESPPGDGAGPPCRDPALA
jgi:N-acetylmuramoyl-L-alanine amidase